MSSADCDAPEVDGDLDRQQAAVGRPSDHTGVADYMTLVVSFHALCFRSAQDHTHAPVDAGVAVELSDPLKEAVVAWTHTKPNLDQLVVPMG